MSTSTQILWAQHKYEVMYHSQRHYNAIRIKMREQQLTEVVALIEEALAVTPTEGSMRNACQHMWGYFRNVATTEQQQYFHNAIVNNHFIEALEQLATLAKYYQIQYLLESTILQRY